MKRFIFLWGTLLLVVLACTYCASLAVFVSHWFWLLAIATFIPMSKLIKTIGFEARALTKTQRKDLSDALYRHGYLFILVAIACGYFISRKPHEEWAFLTALGIGGFCLYALSFALRNYLDSID